MATNTRSRAAIIVAVAVMLAIVAVLTWSRFGDEDDPVEDAIALLSDERRFDSSREAVQAFAAVYEHLVEATTALAKDCEASTGARRCVALNEAAAWSLGFSPASGHCTQPAVHEGRAALLAFLRATAELEDDAQPPALPPVPAC